MIHKSAFLLARVYSAFHPSGVGTMSRGDSLFGGDEPLTFTKGLKRNGTNQGVHTYMPCMLVAGLVLQSKDWGVKSVRVNSAFHP